jgi:hypothetical protein
MGLIVSLTLPLNFPRRANLAALAIRHENSIAQSIFYHFFGRQPRCPIPPVTSDQILELRADGSMSAPLI